MGPAGCLGDSCDGIVAVKVARDALSSGLAVPKAELLQNRDGREFSAPADVNTYDIKSRVADSRCSIQARK